MLPDNYCEIHMRAYRILGRLERSKLDGTKLYKMLANEYDRGLYMRGTRLHLAVPKVEAFYTMLVEAGRSRPKRRAAIAAIKAARVRVR